MTDTPIRPVFDGSGGFHKFGGGFRGLNSLSILKTIDANAEHFCRNGL